MMSPPPTSDIVYTRLFWGADKAVTIGELAEGLLLPRRSVEAAVEALRRSGAPICTGSRGVWLTQSGDELMAQYRALRTRAYRQLLNLRQLRKTAQSLQDMKVRQTTLPWAS